MLPDAEDADREAAVLRGQGHQGRGLLQEPQKALRRTKQELDSDSDIAIVITKLNFVLHFLHRHPICIASSLTCHETQFSNICFRPGGAVRSRFSRSC